MIRHHLAIVFILIGTLGLATNSDAKTIAERNLESSSTVMGIGPQYLDAVSGIGPQYDEAVMQEQKYLEGEETWGIPPQYMPTKPIIYMGIPPQY